MYGLQDSVSSFIPSLHNDKLRTGEFWANKDINLQIRAGDSIGLVGRNGAGKTTLLKILNGLIKPDAGSITIKGKVGALIALGAGFNPILTGRENLFINGMILGLTRTEIENKLERILSFAELGSAIDDPVQSYSSGMSARLGFAIPAFLETDILLIDEVLAVGDIKFRMKCYSLLKDRLAQGASIILVSHNEVDLSRACTRAVLMESGHITCDDSVSKVLQLYNQSLFQSPTLGQEKETNLRILSLELHSTAGEKIAELSTHQDVQLVCVFEAKQPIPQARILFHLDEAKLGRLCSGSSACKWQGIDIPVGISTAKINFPKIPLLQGSYRFLVDVYGPEITDYYCLSPEVRFSVVSPETDPFGYGMYHAVHIPHDWESPRVI